ncbi:hypothetical protein MICRO8M_100392 [Microbacterium sp. 8M]|nr:hypothetical protein MICRO8M_100392 [Microbacterium sp. 8M]
MDHVRCRLHLRGDRLADRPHGDRRDRAHVRRPVLHGPFRLPQGLTVSRKNRAALPEDAVLLVCARIRSARVQPTPR